MPFLLFPQSYDAAYEFEEDGPGPSSLGLVAAEQHAAD